MRCPHGNGPPERCSQCLGASTRHVVLEAGNIAIDGAHVGSAAEQEAIANYSVTRRPLAQLIRGGKRSNCITRKCSNCGAEGHTARICSKR